MTAEKFFSSEEVPYKSVIFKVFAYFLAIDNVVSIEDRKQGVVKNRMAVFQQSVIRKC